MNETQAKQFNSFTNPDGSNYRKEGVINIKQLSNKLEQVGIKPIELIQLWRNITGKVEYEGEIRFFKMASTEGISQKLENEVLWNNFVNSNLQNFSLKVPKIIKIGKTENLSYYISEFIEGKPLAAKWEDGQLNPKVNNLQKYLSQISNFAAELQNITVLTISEQITQLHNLSENRTIPDEDVQTLQFKITSWIQPESVIQTNLDKLYNLVAENITSWKFCINHADFVPWHVLESACGQLYLIDGEHSSLKPDFYDVAYFYHRTFTQAERPDLAKEFLQLTYSKLNPEKQALFHHQFPSVLASRIIGGYYDAVNDKQTDLTFHHQLKDLLEAEDVDTNLKS